MMLFKIAKRSSDRATIRKQLKRCQVDAIAYRIVMGKALAPKVPEVEHPRAAEAAPHPQVLPVLPSAVRHGLPFPQGAIYG